MNCNGCGWKNKIVFVDEYGKGFCEACIKGDENMKPKSNFSILSGYNSIIGETAWTVWTGHTTILIANIAKYSSHGYCLHRDSLVVMLAGADSEKIFRNHINCINYAEKKWISFIKKEAKSLGV